AVQPFEQFSARDFGRPGRDDLSGMLPPKLAIIMINLAANDTISVLLDPFCGSGTILSEALLLGYKNLIGSDISEKAVADTKTNLDWIANKFRRDLPDIKIFKKPSRRTFPKIIGQFCRCYCYRTVSRQTSARFRNKTRAEV